MIINSKESKMNKSISLMLLAGLLASGPLWAQNLARVNGVAIPSSREEAMIGKLASQGRPDSPQLREAVKNQLITYELIMQEASKQDLAKQPEVATQLEFARQNVIVGAFFQDFVKKNPVSDADIKAEYGKIKAQYEASAKEGAPKEYLSRHILVKTEPEAKAALAKLKGGAKFEVLAKQVSIDTSNKDTGGQLDWGGMETYDPDFTKAMVALSKGQTTASPVKTQFGWHIIRLDDVREVAFPTLEQTREKILESLRQQRVEAMLADLRSKAKIE
jgi:peptidyl-prolyl cis-trans isomerase C